MLAPAPGTMPMNRPTNAVQTMCHHFCSDDAQPVEGVGPARRLGALAPSSLTIIFSSIITSASEMANRPISAGTSGTPS